VLLEGRNAVIYGGGGAIGGAVARAFAREGARCNRPSLASRSLHEDALNTLTGPRLVVHRIWPLVVDLVM
jgi:NAD(P)-dependent dehydrogenase (short-subunit alcohol dehydrogenase family)